ncbi:ABC transporter ATP-binding protein [Helcococcus bovis]|uniref:ABC transporter ATP-binding protein n=1 Tax=Helcococcus bovis TaxID=3153252 RepID=A0ABW9F8A7_9FIRM
MNFLYYLRKRWKLTSVIILLNILEQFCVVFWGFSTAKLITNISGKNINEFRFWLILMIADITIWIFEIYLKKIYYQKWVQETNIEIRKDITKKLLNTDYNEYVKKDTGAYISWLTNDISMINDYGFDVLNYVIGQVISIIFSVIATVYFNFSILFTMIILAIFVINAPKLFKKKVQSEMEKVSIENENLTNDLTDIFNGYEDLKFLNLEDYMINRVERSSRKLARQRYIYADISGKMLSVVNGTSLVSQVILFSQTAYLFFYGLLPIGAISGIQYFSALIFSGLTGLSANLLEMKAVNPIFKKFDDIIESKSIELLKINSSLNNSIDFKNINFRYGNNTKILNNFSYNFEKGKKYVIIGDSGKGKTTLLNILIGKLENYDGDIMWDNKNIKEINKDSIRNKIIYLNQNPHIFNASIKENILLSENISIDRLNKVIKDVGLEPWIKTLPDGINTIIKMNGKNISGGQKQRIVIARGLLRNKDIILLDESTSSLHNEAALEIEKMIFSNNDLTVIMVTHLLREEIKNMIDDIIKM